MEKVINFADLLKERQIEEERHTRVQYGSQVSSIPIRSLDRTSPKQPSSKIDTYPKSKELVIDINKINKNNTKEERLINENKEVTTRLSSKLIGQASVPSSEIERELASNQSADPIKRTEDIQKVCNYFLDNKEYRNYMLFVVGINFGLRASDLLSLRFLDLINPNLTFKDEVTLLEKKTKKTRKQKRNRYITINRAVIEAVTLYLENSEGTRLDDYMFRSESNRGINENKPLSITSLDRILKGVANAVGLNMKVSTHTLRKTFAYHQMMMGGNSHRRLLLLQKMLGHSSAAQTLDYIGLTGEEMEFAYRELNLGLSSGSNLIMDQLGEERVG